MRGDVGAWFVAMPGFAHHRIDHQHVHRVGLVQQRHGVGHRAAGFARGFPRDHDAPGRQRRGAAIGHHQYRTAGMAQHVMEIIVYQHLLGAVARHRRQYAQVRVAGLHGGGVLRIQRHRLGHAHFQRHRRMREFSAQSIRLFARALARFLVQTRIDVVRHRAPVAGHRRRHVHRHQHRDMRIERFRQCHRRGGRGPFAVRVHVGNQDVLEHDHTSLIDWR